MCKLDDYIEGIYDENAPFNQPDQDDQIDSISDALEENDIERALELLSQVQKDVNLLRELAKQSKKTFQFNKLNKIYQKL